MTSAEERFTNPPVLPSPSPRFFTSAGIRDDDYQRVYHNHIMCPEHCEHCIYQALPRYGDITIGDFWGISKLDPHIKMEKGVSAILCNNPKADKWLKIIDEKDFAVMKKVPLNWLGGNGYAVTGKNFALPKRDVFYSLINEHDFSEAVNMTLKPYYQDMRKNEIETKQIQAMFSAKMSHFRFDPAIWQQHFTANSIVLSVPAGKSPPKKYASLYLGKTLEKGKKYTMYLRFKIKTSSSVVNFHIKASENDNLQIIGSYKINGKTEALESMKIEFTPDSNIYDEFMIGASQISGEDNYFVLEYLYVI